MLRDPRNPVASQKPCASQLGRSCEALLSSLAIFLSSDTFLHRACHLEVLEQARIVHLYSNLSCLFQSLHYVPSAPLLLNTYPWTFVSTQRSLPDVYLSPIVFYVIMRRTLVG